MLASYASMTVRSKSLFVLVTMTLVPVVSLDALPPPPLHADGLHRHTPLCKWCISNKSTKVGDR